MKSNSNWRWSQHEEDVKNEDDLKNNDELKDKGNLKNKNKLKNQDNLKIEGHLKNVDFHILSAICSMVVFLFHVVLIFW